MAGKTLLRDIQFLFEMGSMRFLPRTWRQYLQTDVANNSEHTFRVMWLALIIARHEKVENEEKIIKLALVHDIGEARTPDTNYISKLYSTRDEKTALKDIVEKTSLSKDFEKLYKEYAERKSMEAKIVKDADNLDVDFELAELSFTGHKIKSVWSRSSIRDGLFTKTAKKIWDELQTANPSDWHARTYEKYNPDKKK